MTDTDHDRVTERRIDLSLPILEGGEDAPELTAEILARLRAAGMIESSTRPLRTWLAAAVVLLAAAVAIGISLRRPSAAATAAEVIREVPPQASTPVLAAQNPGRPPDQDPTGRTPVAPGTAPDAPLDEGQGNSWFEDTERDLGTHYPRDVATGAFPFHNPSDEPRRLLHFRQSCNCSKAKITVGNRQYLLETDSDDATVLARVVGPDGIEEPRLVDSIEVGPGEAGVIEVEMEMRGTRGRRYASIGFSLDDPELRSVTLSFHALGAEYFTVTPAEVNLGSIRWDESREFAIEVTSPVVEGFVITGFDPPPPGLTVSYHRSAREGRTHYSIQGLHQPPGKGGTLVFHTDQGDRSFTVRVTSIIEEPVRVEPQFVSFGRIGMDAMPSRKITIRPHDAFDLRVTGLEVQGLSFDPGLVRTSWAALEAGAVEVTVQLLPGIPVRTVARGELTVHLNHPAAASRTILFNGFVR